MKITCKYKRKQIPKTLRKRQLIALEVCVEYLNNPERYTTSGKNSIVAITDKTKLPVVIDRLSFENALLMDLREMKTADLDKLKVVYPYDLMVFICYAASLGYNALIIRDNEDCEVPMEEIFPGICKYFAKKTKEENA